MAYKKQRSANSSRGSSKKKSMSRIEPVDGSSGSESSGRAGSSSLSGSSSSRASLSSIRKREGSHGLGGPRDREIGIAAAATKSNLSGMTLDCCYRPINAQTAIVNTISFIW